MASNGLLIFVGTVSAIWFLMPLVWWWRVFPSTSKKVDMKCPMCEIGNLTPGTWSGEFQGISAPVDNLECMNCDTCGADPIFTDQIRRNQDRIIEARKGRELCRKCRGHQTSTDSGNQPCKECLGTGFVNGEVKL